MMTTQEQRTGETATWDSDMNSDALFDVMASTRRRFVISHLQTRSRPAAVADVATVLTNWESDVANEHIPKEEVISRYISLHHVHIPKMAEVGIIEWNHERNTVSLTEGSDGILDDYSLQTFGEAR